MKEEREKLDLYLALPPKLLSAVTKAIETQAPEAPGSLNLKFATKHGFEAQFTLRSFAEHPGSDLLPKLNDIEKQLIKHKCRPIYGNNRAPKAEAREPEAEEDEAQEKPDKIECPIHPGMYGHLKTKNGASWYSHKLDDGTWCNCKEKK